MKRSKLIWIKIDKSKNIYKIEPSEFNKILRDKITEAYKVDNINNNTINYINNDAARLTIKLKIRDKLGKLNSKNAYILFNIF